MREKEKEKERKKKPAEHRIYDLVEMTIWYINLRLLKMNRLIVRS